MQGATPRRVTICLAALLSLAAAPAEAPQAIGSWLLQCPPAGGCTLQDRDWVVPPGTGGPSAALEVQRRGDALVPVVTLRGLTTQMAVGGLLTLQPRATLRFVPGPSAELACELDGDAVVCAPQGHAVAETAAALPVARTVAIGMQFGASGTTPLPGRTRDLALAGTREALARLRSAGAAGEALPAEPGLDWIGFIDRVLRAAGFRNGAMGLLPQLAGAPRG